jgi:hypothetical protein
MRALSSVNILSSVFSCRSPTRFGRRGHTAESSSRRLDGHRGDCRVWLVERMLNLQIISG